MHHFELIHDFDVPPDTLWNLFFDEGFNRFMYGALDIATRDVLELTDTGDTVHRVQRLTPRRRIPGFVHKLVPDQTYLQRDTLHRRDRCMHTIVEPKLLSGKVDIRGVNTVEPLPGGRSRRIFAGDISIAVPLFGGQLETVVLGQMRNGYDRGSQAANDYIATLKQ